MLFLSLRTPSTALRPWLDGTNEWRWRSFRETSVSFIQDNGCSAVVARSVWCPKLARYNSLPRFAKAVWVDVVKTLDDAHRTKEPVRRELEKLLYGRVVCCVTILSCVDIVIKQARPQEVCVEGRHEVKQT